MIVCNDLKLCYLHMPKTGGTSVSDALAPHSGVPWTKTNDDKISRSKLHTRGGQHDTYEECLAGQFAIKGYTIAASIRSPWSRMVSLFHNDIPRKGDESFTEFVERWYSFPKSIPNAWRRTMSRFIGPSNFKIRFEHMQEDMDTLMALVGHERVQLPHRNFRGYPAWRTFYNKDTAEQVGGIWSEDVERFGYRFEDNAHE